MGGTVTIFDKYIKFNKLLQIGLLSLVLQGCMLTTSKLDPNGALAVSEDVCGLRAVRNCDGALPIYDDVVSGTTTAKNVLCQGSDLTATCEDLTFDDGEGPYNFWVPTSINNCPAGYISTKISSPLAFTYISFTCTKN